MDLMTRAEFDELVGFDGETRISLFVPTHRVSGPKESEEDRLRWKNLLTALESELLEDGHARRDVEELLAPAWDLHGDTMAWSHMADGLAMFLRPGWNARYRVPLDLPELATIASEFILTPLLQLLSDRNYVVLALSQKDVRVLRGSRDRIIELDLPSVPESFGDVFVKDGPQSDTVPRPNASGNVGGGAVYYGADTLDNAHQAEMVEFFREVARGVEGYLAGRTVPVILAGLPEWISVYRGISSYPHVVEAAIEKNPDDMSDDDLRHAAWDLVEARLEQENARLLDRFHEQRGNGSGAFGVEEVRRAADDGRVDTLMVTSDGCYGGTNGTPQVVRPLRDQDDVCGQIAATARAALRAGGAVRVLDELPGGTLAAAVLRY